MYVKSDIAPAGPEQPLEFESNHPRTAPDIENAVIPANQVKILQQRRRLSRGALDMPQGTRVPPEPERRLAAAPVCGPHERVERTAEPEADRTSRPQRFQDGPGR